MDRFTEYGDRVLPLGTSYEGLPRSSFNNGTCERASVGLYTAGRLSMPPPSPSLSESPGTSRDACPSVDSAYGLDFESGGENLALVRPGLKGEVLRDGGLECGLESPEGGVLTVGVGELEG